MEQRSVEASFLEAEQARRAASDLSGIGIPASLVRLEAERVSRGARRGRQRSEVEDLVVGPGVTVPGPAGRAALAGAAWGALVGAAVGAVAGLIVWLVSSGARLGLATLISVVSGAVAGSVFGAVWAGASRADQDAAKTESAERRAIAVRVAVSDREVAIDVVRRLKNRNPDHIMVLDGAGRPVSDSSEEALWLREA